MPRTGTRTDSLLFSPSYRAKQRRARQRDRVVARLKNGPVTVRQLTADEWNALELQRSLRRRRPSAR